MTGTLADMAPEQTGRMNRSVDARSDLYSLGVTFYEMLVGALPFTAGNPLEWVHCHLARVPAAPKSRVREIPEPLSAMVMKLLAKTPENRDQTASAVEADLRCCLAEWEARGRIERFALGAHDVPDRLSVPEKLYGREREVGRLLEAFGRVVRSGTTELVLVSGCSGVGKSSVVNELNKALVPSCGLFASGKFDQFKRRRLGNRPIERLADLPPMTDPACRATLDVLTAVLSSAWFTNTNLHDLLVARMANLSLEHGNSDGSCNAYAVLGTVLGSHFGDYQAGLRFCKLGQTLLMAP